MKHLDDEDIALMIDGRVSKEARERFLKHLFQCDTCFKIYNESLNFIEQEDKKKIFFKMPNHGKIADQFWQPTKTMLANKGLIPVYTVFLIAIILLPFLLIKDNSRIEYIEKSIAGLKSNESHYFMSSNNLVYAAVRTGIFTEELLCLSKYSGEENLKGEVVHRLVNELRVIFKTEVDSLLPDLVYTEEGAFETAVWHIKHMLDQQLLGEFFQFGRFVEQSIFSSFNNKLPCLERVGKYRQLIVYKYHKKLPVGVLKELNKFSGATRIRESNDIFMNIKEIFLSAE